jgi:hypothetical protein
MNKAKLEKLLIESLKNILEQNEVGDNSHSHHVQFQWEDITRDFAIHVKNSSHFDALNAAFYKIHSYKWLEDPSFCEAFESELNSMGTPEEDIKLAFDAIEKLRKEYCKETQERDAGWPEELDEMQKDPENTEVTDTKKETMSGDNEPYEGAEPKNVRPIKNEA